MKRRLKLKITTISQQTIAATGELLCLSCPVCERDVQMLSDLQALRILKIERQTLDRLVANGQVHSIQTVSGNVWVCKDSLFLK